MKYDGYAVGPVLRNLRTDRKITVERLSDMTGISTSAIKQIEQGGRNLSMKNLYIMMEAYGVDANTILNIQVTENKESIDQRLSRLPKSQRDYFAKTFLFMMENVNQVAS